MIPRPTGYHPPKRCFCIDLAVIDYRDAWTLQADLVTARWKRDLDRDVVLLLEHPPVVTLGKRGGRANLTVSEAMLTDRGIPIVQVERGGDITFHGPGQLVVYPIMDLASARLGVADYVEMLEEVVIGVAGDWGIAACRNRLNRGVWVGDRKLGSIGIAVRRGICFHGMALNVNLSLEPFSWIHPCGLRGIGITSMERELGQGVVMEDVRADVKHRFQHIFGIELAAATIDELPINKEDRGQYESK